MSANVSTTFGQHFGMSIAENGGAASVETVDQALSAILGQISSDESGMVIIIGGDATAVGENTLATADVVAVIAGDANVQTAHAQASFLALGESDSASAASAYATATSFGEIAGEADYFFVLNYSMSTSSQNEGSSTWTAASLTEVFALNIEGIPGTDDVSVELVPANQTQDEDVPADEWDPCGCGQDNDWTVTIDGNLAIFNVAALAIGDDSLATVEFSAITVEDQISVATAIVTVAID